MAISTRVPALGAFDCAFLRVLTPTHAFVSIDISRESCVHTPDEDLPDTGASPTLLLTVGLGLVAAAGFLLRRRFAGAAE
jgi:LPXTG-motif cell wall-anchored protein